MSEENTKQEAVFVFALSMTQDNIANFCMELIAWSDRHPGDRLRININSDGGNVSDSLSFKAHLQMLRRRGHHLTIAVYGRALSCAAWLLQFADVRIMDEDAWLMIHEVSSRVDGPSSAIRRELERVMQLEEQTFGMLCKRSKLTMAVIRSETRDGREWFIPANEAMELGLIDRIENDPEFIENPSTDA